MGIPRTTLPYYCTGRLAETGGCTSWRIDPLAYLSSTSNVIVDPTLIAQKALTRRLLLRPLHDSTWFVASRIAGR